MNLLTNEEARELIPQGYQILYRIDDKNVYIVKNEADMKCIIKFISIDDYDKDKYELLQTVDHANIPKVLDVIVTEHYMIRIMAYIEGKTIYDDILENGPYDEDKALRIMNDLIPIFSYLHNINDGIIYRDIHPKNIIINQKSEVFLIDLDSSRLYKLNSQNDTVTIGVIGFIAPEQYGFDQSSVRSDIYSLGVLVAYMLTGEHPTFDKNRIDLSSVDLSKELEDLLYKMTSFAKESRPDSMVDVKRRLNHKRRNKLMIPILVSLVVISLIVVSALSNQPDKQDMFTVENKDDNTEQVEVIEPEDNKDIEEVVLEDESDITEVEVIKPKDNTILSESYESEYFDSIADSVIIDSFEGEWQVLETSLNDNIVVKEAVISLLTDEDYLYLRFEYFSKAVGNTAAFMRVPDVSGVFAKYHLLTENKFNDYVLRIDKDDFNNEINESISGFGYDLLEWHKAIVFIDINELIKYQ